MAFVTFTAAILALLTSIVCVMLARRGLGGETQQESARRFHSRGVSRIGGLAIFLGFAAALLVAVYRSALSSQVAVLTLVVALPVFLTGLAEDFTHRVGAAWRLAAAAVSAALAMWLLKSVPTRLDLPLIDGLLRSMPILAIAFALLAMSGVAHAFNLIDGYNGLCGVVSLMILGAFAYVGYKVGDLYVMACAFSLAGAIVGFLVLNYPSGFIMAGDGGAYLIGFLIALLAVALVNQNPQVSAWFPLTAVIYPIWETLFSAYRRRVLKRKSAATADALHFHHLIYRRITRWAVPVHERGYAVKRNSMTAPYLWAVAGFSIAPAALFWNNTSALQVVCALFAVAYVWAYFWLLRGRKVRRMPTS
jgi:UDP-N-acetylmuramyl pentapeptide phosphotransferase/UDP-N-acetylglucosamine-1-phosphate transferase